MIFARLPPPPGSNFFVLSGQHRVEVRYWNGALSAATSVTMNVPGLTSTAPAVNAGMEVYVNENLTGTITPRFRWQHVQGNTWYNVNVKGALGKSIWQMAAGVDGVWFRAYDICAIDSSVNAIMCDVRPDLKFFLPEDTNTFTWQVSAFAPGNTNIATSSWVSFTTNPAATGRANPLYPAVASPPVTKALTDTNQIQLIFERAPNASWYEFLVVRKDSKGNYILPAEYNKWHYLPEPGKYQYPAGTKNRCGGTFTVNGQTFKGDKVCRVVPTHLNLQGHEVPLQLWTNGNYEWWIRAYGPNGLNEVDSASLGWAGPYPFDLDVGSMAAVDVTTIRNQDGVLLDGAIVGAVTGIQWDAVEIAQSYLVQVFKDDPSGLITNVDKVVEYFVFPSDAGCDLAQGLGICKTMVPSTTAVDRSSNGRYQVRIGTWSLAAYDGDQMNWIYPAPGQQQYATFFKP